MNTFLSHYAVTTLSIWNKLYHYSNIQITDEVIKELSQFKNIECMRWLYENRQDGYENIQFHDSYKLCRCNCLEIIKFYMSICMKFTEELFYASNEVKLIVDANDFKFTEQILQNYLLHTIKNGKSG